MERTLCVIFLLSFVVNSQGLNFTLYKNDDTGTDIACTLLCAEDSTMSTNSSKGPTSSTKRLIKTSSSISIFKKGGGSSDDDSIRQDLLLSSTLPVVSNLSSGNSNSTRPSGGIVKLDLFTEEECKAEFTCVVRGLDNAQREVMETATLSQRPELDDNSVDDGALNVNILDSIRSIIVQSVAGLQDKIETVQRDLSQKVDSFHTTFDKRCTEIERSIKNLETKPMDTSDKGVDSSLLDAAVSSQLALVQAEVKDDILISIRNISEELRKTQREGLEKISAGVEQNRNNTFEILESVESNFDHLKSLTEMNMQTFRNETEALWDLIMYGESMRNGTQAASTDVLTHSKDYQPNARSKVQESELQEISNMKTMFAQLIASNACEKGMLASLNQSFPYPVTYPKNTLSFPYPCDATTDGGGWIVIQRRATGNISFNRGWDDYRNGFGSFAGEFWLGNDKLRTITYGGKYELRIDLEFEGASVFAHYDSFSIADERYGYTLSIGAYDGTAGDSLRDNNGRPFSTSDRDKDNSGGNCAEEYNGGWWFVGCGFSCLNGEWGADSNKGMEWRALTGGLSVSFSEMKIRRVS